jgi:hypothetical protein
MAIANYWVGVIFFACVCGGTPDLTTVFDDSITCRSLWVCVPGTFLGGSRGGGKSGPPWLCEAFGSTPRIVFGAVFAILVFFVIFSGFLN